MLDEPIARNAAAAANRPQAHPQGLIPQPANVEKDRFLADLKQFAVDLERLVGQAKALTGEGAAVARRRLDVVVADARRLLDAAGVATADHALDARDRAERYVRDDPWKAIALALTTGMLIALFAYRR